MEKYLDRNRFNYIIRKICFWKTKKVNNAKEHTSNGEEDKFVLGNYELWLKRLAPHSGHLIS